MFMAHISFALLLLHVYRTAALFALSALGDKQVYRVKKGKLWFEEGTAAARCMFAYPRSTCSQGT